MLHVDGEGQFQILCSFSNIQLARFCVILLVSIWTFVGKMSSTHFRLRKPTQLANT